MKTILLSLAFLFVIATQLQAQTSKEYAPVIKIAGNAMDLTKRKTLSSFRKQLQDNNFKDITQASRPGETNVCVMEGKNKGATITYEIYYLNDEQIYELVMLIDSDKERKEKREVTMQVQQIAFNNISNSLYKELGSPTIATMNWTAPYTQKDWEDPKRTAAALMENKLDIFFGYVSSEYKDPGQLQASVYITLDQQLRVKMGVRDVALARVQQDEVFSGFIESLLSDEHNALSTTQRFSDYMNAHMTSAQLVSATSSYPFAMVGKTDENKSSFFFVVQDTTQLYLQTLLPKTVKCPKYFDALKAEYVKHTVNKKGDKDVSITMAFSFPYQCEGLKYQQLEVVVPIPEDDPAFLFKFSFALDKL